MQEPPAPGPSPATVVHAVEEIVDRAVFAAERSLARRIGVGGLRAALWTLRAAGWLLIAGYFVFGALLLVARYSWMPRIDQWRPQIEQLASQALQAPVSIAHVEADWQGLNPRITLGDVRLQDGQGQVVLRLPEVEAVASWTSLLTLSPRLDALTVLAPELEIERLPGNLFRVAGVLIDPHAANGDTALADWVLRQRRITIRDARVHFVDSMTLAPGAELPGPAPAADAAATLPGPAADVAATLPGPAAAGPAAPVGLDFTEVNFVLTRGLRGHRFAVQARPPARLAGLIDLRGEFHRPWSAPPAQVSAWSGRLYAQLDYADLALVERMARIVPAPMQLQHANGAVRAWIDFSTLQLERLRADLALTEVEARLGPDLQPLRLASVQGRLTQHAWHDAGGDGLEVALTGLTLAGPDELHLPATDLLYRHLAGAPGRAEHTDVEANALSLADLSRLAARVPLPAAWRKTIDSVAPRGQLSDVRGGWDGDPAQATRYALRANFAGLGCAAEPAAEAPVDSGEQFGAAPAPMRPGRPGFEGMAGHVDLDQDGGSLQLDASDARLTLPGVFAEELALGRVQGRLRYTRAGSGLRVDVDSLSVANPELGLSVSGNYRREASGAGVVDLSGRLGAGQARTAYHYIPLIAAPARRWVHGALLDGRIVDGSFRLRGDLADFPFADPARGDFRAEINVADARLDVSPVVAAGEQRPRPLWPLLEGIQARVQFERQVMRIDARQASVYGVRLGPVGVRIAHLDKPDQHLLVDGQGSGPLADLLRFVNNSPVGGMIGRSLARAEATGNARLRLRLDLPLGHANDTEVAGNVVLQNDDFSLRPDVAPWSGLGGQVDFTQRGVRLSNLSGGFVGGQVRIDGDTAADGTITVRASGSATPAGTRRQIDLAPLRRLLDHARGTFRYSGLLTLRHGNTTLRIDSDLLGVAFDFPEPLRKSAGEPMPLRIDVVPTGVNGERDVVRASLGRLVSLQLERSARPGTAADAGAGPMHIDRGAVGIGTDAILPDAGLQLGLDLPQLDADRWKTVLDAAFSDSTGGPADDAGGLRVDYVAARVAALTIDGKTIEHLVLGASRALDDGWNINLDADQASGALHWVGAQHGSASRLSARLARLTIPEGQKQDVTQLLDTPPTEVPALELVADDFVLGSAHLGRLEVGAQVSGPDGNWVLQKLELDNPDGKLSASGLWQREGHQGGRRMNLKLALAVANAGNLLGRFGLAGVVRNGNGHLDGEISWRGSPFSIDYASLTGKLHLETDKGQFLKADAGAARLLGVMSLQSLPRRITFDFRDVFSSGFAFDSIRANAEINAGVLTTHDFKMRGVSATALIDGSTDLRAETQNLHVLVIPEINAGSASLVYALLANPAIGLGTFLAQWVLRDPLSKAFSYDLDVTGSWAEPQVKRRDKQARAGGDEGGSTNAHPNN